MRASTTFTQSLAALAVAVVSGCASPTGSEPPLEGGWTKGATYTLNRAAWLVQEPRTKTYYLIQPGARGGDPGPHKAQILERNDSTKTICEVAAGTHVQFTHATVAWTVDYKIIREWGKLLGGTAPGTTVVLDSLSDSQGGDYPYRSRPDPRYLSLTPIETEEK